MTDWVRQVLERYGQDVTVDTADGERTVRAFLQPMTERDERARSDVTSIGWVDGRLWLYLGQTALTLARELSGAGEAEEALLELLCQAAEQQWEKRLRPGMTTEDCGKAFPCAVAFTAAADLAAARGGEGVSGFTAGSVSVRIRGAAESCALAESLRRTAERLMAPFAVPDDFCFRGVRG